MRGERAVRVRLLARDAQVEVREHVPEGEELLPQVPVGEVVQVLGPVAQSGQFGGFPDLDAFHEVHEIPDDPSYLLSKEVGRICETGPTKGSLSTQARGFVRIFKRLMTLSVAWKCSRILELFIQI